MQAPATQRIAYLGPEGTFTEQALLTQGDYSSAELVGAPSIEEVLAATESGEADLGFVPIENSIEGSVHVTLDSLIFERRLLIQREVVHDVQLNLVGVSGASLGDIRTVVSMPVATAQCRLFLSEHLRGVETRAANSTAEAARLVAEEADPTQAAIAPALAAKIFSLANLASDVEDHPENQTRFVAVATTGIPAPSGHDKTSLVVFQRTDRPGSLLAILQEFAARAINLTKLESRPTKQGLGDYCFLIDLEGHVADEVVGDALRNLRAKTEDVKFLGSYPAAGQHGPAARRDTEASWRAADRWLQSLRHGIHHPGYG